MAKIVNRVICRVTSCALAGSSSSRAEDQSGSGMNSDFGPVQIPIAATVRLQSDCQDGAAMRGPDLSTGASWKESNMQTHSKTNFSGVFAKMSVFP